jgi:tRNA-binding protein
VSFSWEDFERVDMRVGVVVKRIGPFVSEVLVLGAYDDAGDVILLRPDVDVSPGSRIG